VGSESLASQMKAKHSASMRFELEAVALRLFEEHGFKNVTVANIAAEGGTSVRTYYRYFPVKEDVLQVRIDQGSEALRVALHARPADEPLLHGIRMAYEEVFRAEDAALMRRWMTVVASTPGALMGVIGGLQLKAHPVVAEFFGERLGLTGDALVPTMMAGAIAGVVQVSLTRWFLLGGELPNAIAEGLAVLESASSTGISKESRD
jgi:TetR/AcrR family transcriptional regulator, regulator of mycofactocin system